MADNQSCGNIYVFECIECKSEFHTSDKVADGMNCPKCKGCLNPKNIKAADNGEKIGSVRYDCLSCGHNEIVRRARKHYSEIILCSKCNGLSVDMYKNSKYVHLAKRDKPIGSRKVEIDVSDAIKGLKAVERQAKKTTRALREVETLIN